MFDRFMEIMMCVFVTAMTILISLACFVLVMAIKEELGKQNIHNNPAAIEKSK